MTRRASLDGLRGLAAAIVLVHHALLTLPALARPAEETTPLVYALTYTPLRALWEGKGAVYVFFVLSGVVLTLAVTRQQPYSWLAYYPQRLLRLYLPVWGAVVLGILSILLIPRDPGAASAWLGKRAHEPTPDRILRDITLVNGHGGLVSPLWSLRWEILFSLLLPVFVFIGLRWVRHRWAVAAGCLVLVGAGIALGIAALTFLPIFLLGVLIAASIDDLDAFAQRIRPGLAAALAVGGPLLLVAPWLVGPSIEPGPIGSAVLEMLAVSGAALMVVGALAVGTVNAALSTPIMRWFGRISFSLYLVHEQVVISVATLFGDAALLPAMVVSVPASIALAWVFYRLVEVPSHKLARALGHRVRRSVPVEARR